MPDEEPLRRSPRKQNPAPEEVTAEAPASSVNPDEANPDLRRSSRTKQHKNKTKHHKEKRKKRKHGKEEPEAQPENPPVEPEKPCEIVSAEEAKVPEPEIAEPEQKESPKKDLSLFQDLTSSTAVNGIEPEVPGKPEFPSAEGLIAQVRNIDNIGENVIVRIIIAM